MFKFNPYLDHAQEYDEWFEKNRHAYSAELTAVRSVIGAVNCPAVEVGVGTGRFAVPLGIDTGVEPTEGMAVFARRRGIRVIRGMAEDLPLKKLSFGLVLMVTVVCFIDDIYRAFAEARRVLCKDGRIIIGIIDKNSPQGQVYFKKKQDSLFYKQATFYSVDDILEILRDTGFEDFSIRQTIFKDPHDSLANDPVRPGYGEGLFAVIGGKKIGG